MNSKETGGQPGFTPKGGSFCETAAMTRLKVQEGKMSPEEAQRLVNIAWSETMRAQLLGIDLGGPDELPEYTERFNKIANGEKTA